MHRPTNRQSAGYVAQRAAFKGSNLCGGWEGDVYVVRSYDTPIMAYSRVTQEWYMTKERFSTTTSKHQYQASAGIICTGVDQDELLQVINTPGYRPLTELDKRGMHVGDVVRVTNSNGAYIAGSLVRIDEYTSMTDRIEVTPIIAVRTRRHVYSQIPLRSVESLTNN